MSDSVDRVFVHALATVRRLPRTGSSRPPPASRLRLYGLYKQSMEGDVLAILPRPTLPVFPPDGNNNSNSSSLNRQASRDARRREAQAEIEKWDAWYACAGMSRTQAKREYISTLIETMKEYASGTAESRELIGELEFVWNQICDQNGEEGSDRDEKDDGNENGKKRRERRGSVRRSEDGLIGSRQTAGSKDVSGDGGGGRGTLSSKSMDISREIPGKGQQQTPKRHRRTPSGLRVLSPVSQDSNSINEPIEQDHESDDDENDDNDDNDDDDDHNDHNKNQHSHSSPSSPKRNNLNSPDDPSDLTSSLSTLQRTLESQLSTLKTEIAALREQLSANQLLSASTYTLGHHYYSLSRTQRLLHRARVYARAIAGTLLRQALAQLCILAAVLLWGRCTGDLRAEAWVRRCAGRVRSQLSRAGSAVLWLLGPLGRLINVGKLLLRIA